jgi:hypothetical protein
VNFLFSCALPYALALGVLGAWVAAFDALDHRLLLYWRDGEIVPDQT